LSILSKLDIQAGFGRRLFAAQRVVRYLGIAA